MINNCAHMEAKIMITEERLFLTEGQTWIRGVPMIQFTYRTYGGHE